MESYTDEKIMVWLQIHTYGSATASHTESLLNSNYSIAGNLSASEVIYDQYGTEANHYSWGNVSGVATMNASTVAEATASGQVTTENGGVTVTTKIESADDSFSFTCAPGSTTSFGMSLSALGFLACDFSVDLNAQCNDIYTNKKVEVFSDASSWDLHYMLDY